MRTLLLVLGLTILSPLVALAGGDSFLAEIVSLRSESKNEYRLEVIKYTAPYGSTREGLPKRLIVHVRFNDRMFTRDCQVCPTKEKYLAAIESLKAQAAKGGKFPFGVMSDGYDRSPDAKASFRATHFAFSRSSMGAKLCIPLRGQREL